MKRFSLVMSLSLSLAVIGATLLSSPTRAQADDPFAPSPDMTIMETTTTTTTTKTEVTADGMEVKTNPATVSDGSDVIYLYSQGFPPASVAQYPSPPIGQTRFWQLLDKEMRASQTLALTENLEDAKYRVDIVCAGITHCSKVKVYIKSPQRDILSSYSLNVGSPFTTKPLETVALSLSTTLQEKINELAEGGYGYHKNPEIEQHK